MKLYTEGKKGSYIIYRVEESADINDFIMSILRKYCSKGYIFDVKVIELLNNRVNKIAVGIDTETIGTYKEDDCYVGTVLVDFIDDTEKITKEIEQILCL